MNAHLAPDVTHQRSGAVHSEEQLDWALRAKLSHFFNPKLSHLRASSLLLFSRLSSDNSTREGRRENRCVEIRLMLNRGLISPIRTTPR